jgi:hypothetical protein
MCVCTALLQQAGVVHVREYVYVYVCVFTCLYVCVQRSFNRQVLCVCVSMCMYAFVC